MARSCSEAALLGKYLTQKPSGNPFHHDVRARTLRVGEGPHDIGMVEHGANLLFALETVDEAGVGGGVGNLDGDLAAVAEIGGAINGGHRALGDTCVEAEAVELPDGFGRRVVSGE